MGALPMTGFVRGHVSVDLLENVAGAAGKAALSAISMASTLAFALLVAWQLVLRALDQAGEGLLTPILGWPTWPVIAFAAAAATVAVLVQVALLLGADAREAASGDWD
ncbi:MAG: TRAP transporter small permease subunit [Boseongicola sp. SB0673_bin_14]|nr:TRAP transporter small permease subunit [Boseongicola sp. SB0673_bin_14]